MKKTGFTLAEVLITLGIIGVVAALTIPILVDKSQKQAQVIQLKKFYSVFTQGLRTHMANTGCSDLSCTDLFVGDRNTGAWRTNMNSTMRSIFKIGRDCLPASGSCNQTTKQLGNATTSTEFSSGYSFQTIDGYLFEVWDWNTSNCTFYSSTTSSSKLKGHCAEITVDVNGVKPPNVWGRDVHLLILGNDGNLYPSGGVDDAKIINDSDDYSSTSAYWRNNDDLCGDAANSVIGSTTTGKGCAARIIEENWAMNY